MVSKAHRGMIHIPRGGGGQRPPYYGGPPSRTPFPPRDRYLPMPFPPYDRRPRPPYYGGGRPMPPFFGGRSPYDRRPPFFGGGYGGGYPFRPPFGANPFNPFRPRRHPKDLMLLLQKQMEARDKFNQAVRGGNNSNFAVPLNRLQQTKEIPQVAQAVPMQVAEATPAPTTRYADRLPPPRPPRIAVDPVRRRRIYPAVLRNKGGLMKRRHA